MRIHSDILTYKDIYSAANLAMANVEKCNPHGSRSRQGAFEVALRGLSKRRPNFYNGDGQYAATWDQWGVFLSRLFEIDPDMLIGSGQTAGDSDGFWHRTNGRFEDAEVVALKLGIDGLSHDHVFRFAGIPCSQTCIRCGAASQSW